MRAVVQRVARASVSVEGRIVGAIDDGLCVLVGALEGDDAQDVAFLARKLAGLRIFHDDDGKMNRSVLDISGAMLVISQFTLAADTTSGTRPSFTSALHPDQAAPLLEDLATQLRGHGIEVATGVFGAVMDVDLVNRGPVTIYLDSRSKKHK